MAGTQDTPTDPFKHLDKEYYEFEPGQKLFPEPDQQYQLPDEYINDERWLKTVNFIFLDGTIVFKLLTDKTYSLTIKCKTLHSIPDFIRRDRRSARVTQLFLAVNRIKEIPDGMNAFVQVRNCSLDRNELKSLKNEFGMLTSIENLDIGDNQFKTVPREIFMLKSLKVLRLSVNEIEELPTGFAELKYLEDLRIGRNRLRNLPADFGECQSLKYLKLASNRLLEFPTVILKLKGLEQLVISANKIRVLPLELFENEKLQIFHAEGNPLQQPPIEVVNKGLANIREYCQAFKKGDIRDDRLRVLFLGASGAGKTTLCNALIQGHTHEDPERTIGIEQHLYELRDIKMTLWDFAGQSLYYNTHHVFITSGTLVVLIINLEEYRSHHDNNGSDEATNSSYDDLVGFWIDNIAMRVPNAVILVVGTHIDEVENSMNLMADIMKKIKNQLDGESKKLQRRIENLCGAIDDDVNGRRKHIENLKSKAEHKLQVQYETPILVCSKEPKTEGLPKFKDAIVNLARNERLFPDRAQKRPSSWKDTESVIKEARTNTKESITGMRNVEDLVTLVIQKVPGIEKPDQVYPVLRYLHSLGEVIWFDEIEDLRDHVFINPPVLSDIFKMVISDKVDKVVKPENWRAARDYNLTKTKFENEVKEFKKYAMLSQQLLHMLWDEMSIKVTEVERLVKALEQFDLCYTGNVVETGQNGKQLKRKGNPERPETGAMSEKSQDGTATETSRKESFGSVTAAAESDGNANLTEVTPDRKQRHRKPEKVYCLFPCHLTATYKGTIPEQESTTVDSPYRGISNKFELFPVIPYGFFERLLVLCHRDKMKFTVDSVFRDAINVTAWNGVTALIEKKNDESQLAVEIKIKATDGERNIPARQHQIKMWQVIHRIHDLIHKLLHQWPGVRTELYTLCPRCISTGKEPYAFELNLPLEIEDDAEEHQGQVKCIGGEHCGEPIDYGQVYPVGQEQSYHSESSPASQTVYNIKCRNLQIGDGSTIYDSPPRQRESDIDSDQ